MLSNSPFNDTVEEIFVLGGTEVYRVNTLFASLFHESTLDTRLYTMSYKIQPIRIHESCCVFNSIASNLPIICHMCVTLIVLTTLFSMAWYNIVMPCCHLNFLSIYTGLKARL